MLGDVKKSVANLTMYIARGVSIVRGKPMNVHNPRTEKQRVQRAKMKALIRLVSAFSPALHVGYPSASGLVSVNNRFVRDNMDAVTVDKDFKATVDYSKIVCSAARRLRAPKVAVGYDAEENRFVFTQSVQGETPTCNPTDIAWVVVYEKVLDEAEVYELRTRGEGGELKKDLPEDWSIDNCEFYAFARNAEGTSVSRTLHLSVSTV